MGATKKTSTLGLWSSKINDTLEIAKNDLKSSMAKTFTAAATSLSSDKTIVGKSKFFGQVLEHGKSCSVRLEKMAEKQLPLFCSGDGIGTNEDGKAELAQFDISLFNFILREYKDLLEAFELIFVERVYLEETLVVEQKLETLDDLDLVRQYYKGLHDSLAVSKQEIVRLTTAMSELEAKVTTEFVTKESFRSLEEENSLLQTKLDYLNQRSHNATPGENGQSEVLKLESLETTMKQMELKLSAMNLEKESLSKQLLERTEENLFLREKLSAKQRSMSESQSIPRLPIPIQNSTHEVRSVDYLQNLERELQECKRELRRKSSQLPSPPSIDKVPNSLDPSTKKLYEDYEKVMLENLRLKNSVTSDYNRNLVLRFLQKPEKRPEMIDLICKALRFNDKERSSFNLKE